MTSRFAILGLVAASVALATAPGCVVFEAPQYECASDKDCAGQCSDVGVCVSRGKTTAVRLAWTVAGETPSAQNPIACTGVNEVEVHFSGDGADTAFRVECDRGQIHFPRIPDYYDQVTVIAFSSSGSEIGRAQAQLNPRAPNSLRLDVQP